MVKPETLKVGQKAAAHIEINDIDGNPRILAVWGPITKISMFGDRVHLVTIDISKYEIKPYKGSPEVLSEVQIKKLFKHSIPKIIQVSPFQIWHVGDSKITVDSDGIIHVADIDFRDYLKQKYK
jgi:hypothetical protein